MIQLQKTASSAFFLHLGQTKMICARNEMRQLGIEYYHRLAILQGCLPCSLVAGQKT